MLVVKITIFKKDLNFSNVTKWEIKMNLFNKIKKKAMNQTNMQAYYTLQDMFAPLSRNFQVVVVETYTEHGKENIIAQTSFGVLTIPPVLYVDSKEKNKIYITTSGKEFYQRSGEEEFRKEKGNIEIILSENSKILDINDYIKSNTDPVLKRINPTILEEDGRLIIPKGKDIINVYLGNSAYSYLREAIAQKNATDKN